MRAGQAGSSSYLLFTLRRNARVLCQTVSNRMLGLSMGSPKMPLLQGQPCTPSGFASLPRCVGGAGCSVSRRTVDSPVPAADRRFTAHQLARLLTEDMDS